MYLNYSIFNSETNIRFYKLFIKQTKVAEENTIVVYKHRSLSQDLLF